MLDLAQLDIMTAFNTAITLWQLGQVTPSENRKKNPGGGIGGLFMAKDGGWVRVGVYSPGAVDDLRKLMNDDEYDSEKLEKFVSEHDRDEVVDFLLQARIPVAPIYTTEDTCNDPHLAARNMFVEVEHPKAGKYKAVNFPFKMSETQPEIHSTAPLLGQDNKYVICDILGKPEEYFEELKKKGVIAWT